MIKRTLLPFLSILFLVSCASLGLAQQATIAPINGFTINAGSIQPQQGMTMVRQHQGSVMALATVPNTESFFSAGKDGFLSLHNPDGTNESWQLSDIPLKFISVHPDGNTIAIFETDDYSIYRISVWDWKNKTRLYAKRFHDSIMSLSWSAKGTWLIIGNTSVDGITILDGATGNLQTIFKSSPGIITLGITGASETSMVTFGPSGRIRYTDIASGSEKASYSGPKDLEQPVLLKNNTGIAGYANGQIVLVDATSGKTISTWNSSVPVMATALTDSQPTWFEEIPESGWVLRNGNTTSSGFMLPDSSKITTALNTGKRILFGSDSGKIFSVASTNIDPSAALAIDQISTQSIQKIDDFSSDGSRLFMLSSGSLFISSGPGIPPLYAFNDINANKFMLAGDSIISWSTDKNEPLMQISLDGISRKTLYQPKEGIRSVSITGTRLALVEGSSKAIVIDLASGTGVFTYSGAGIQDALLLNPTRLVLSRSSTRRGPNPLLIINTKTEETAPLQINGDLCFGLKMISAADMKLACFIVKAGLTSTTDLITFTVNDDMVSISSSASEATYADEDLMATLLPDNNHMYTNLGKTSIVDINLTDKTQSKLERGYSLPHKIAVMDQYTVTLNDDGSLTWFDHANGKIISNSAITEQGMWLDSSMNQ